MYFLTYIRNRDAYNCDHHIAFVSHLHDPAICFLQRLTRERELPNDWETIPKVKGEVEAHDGDLSSAIKAARDWSCIEPVNVHRDLWSKVSDEFNKYDVCKALEWQYDRSVDEPDQSN